LLVKLADALFGRNTFEYQTDAMESGMPYPKSMAHSKMAIRLFQINDTLKYLGSEAEEYSFARLHTILRKTLKGEAGLTYIEQGGLKSTTKREVVEKLLEVEEILEQKAELRAERKSNHRNHKKDYYSDADTDDEDANNGGNKNQGGNGDQKKPAADGNTKNMCRLHKGAHEWKYCPCNRNSKNYNDTRANKEQAERCSAKGAEVQMVEGDANTTPEKKTVTFLADFDYDSDNESINSVASNGSHFMASGVEEEKVKAKLKPVTVVALRTSKKKFLGATALVDQCFTENALISESLADALGYEKTPIKNGETSRYNTLAGVVETKFEIKVDKIFLPALSRSRHFKTTIQIIPKELGVQEHGMFIGQDLMKAIDLDTSMRTDTLTWGSDCGTQMVAKSYWNEERVAKCVNSLKKRKSKPTEKPAEHPTVQTIVPTEQPTMNPTAEAGDTKVQCNANEEEDARHTTAKSDGKADDARHTTAEFTENATNSPVARHTMTRALQHVTAENDGESKLVARHVMARALHHVTAKHDGEPFARHVMTRAMQHVTANYEGESYKVEGAHFTAGTGFKPGTKMKVTMYEVELLPNPKLGDSVLRFDTEPS